MKLKIYGSMRRLMTVLLMTLIFVTSIPLNSYAAEISKDAPTEIIFVGDSRTVMMGQAVDGLKPYNTKYGSYTSQTLNTKGKSAYYSAKVGESYNWMKAKGVPNIENRVKENTAVVFWMGINAATYIKGKSYADYVNSKAKTWVAKGAKVYYVSVGKVSAAYDASFKKSYKVSLNSAVNTFNNDVKKNLSSNVTFIDISKVTNSASFTDGLHYTSATSKKIFNEIKSQVNADWKASYDTIQAKKIIKGTFTVSEGEYYIKSFIDNNFYVGVTDASLDARAKITLQKGKTASNRWKIEKIGNTGYYRLKNVASGKMLDVTGGGSCYKKGTQLQQFNLNTSANAQIYVIKKNSDGTFSILTKQGGFALDAYNGQMKVGTQIVIWNNHGWRNQKFVLEKYK